MEVRTGADLAAAIASEHISVAIVTVATVQVSDADFAQDVFPPGGLVRTSNFTLRSSDELGDNWAELRLGGTSGKALLANGVHLTVERLVVSQFRRDNPTRAPGIDLLIPSLPGTRSFLVLNNIALLYPACYPPAVGLMNVAALRRPPEFPGSQNRSWALPQAGCVNVSSSSSIEPYIPLLQRCYPIRNRDDDVILYGADVDPQSSNPVHNNQYIVCRKVLNLCERKLDDKCIATFGALGCYFATVGTGNSSSSYTGSGPRSAGVQVAEPAAGGAAAAGGSGGGSGSNETLVAALCGSLIGAALLSLVVVGAVLLRRRRAARMGATDAPPSPHHKPTLVASVASSNTELPPAVWSQDRPSAKFPMPPTYTTPHGGSKAAAQALQLQTGQGSDDAADSSHLPVTIFTPQRPDLRMDVLVAAVGWTAASGYAASEGAAAGPDSGAAAAAAAARFPFNRLGPGVRSCGSDGSSATTEEVQQEEAGTGGADSVRADNAVDLLPTVLGKGAFGQVVEGIFQGQRVAVKLVTDAHLCNSEGEPPTMLLQSLAQEVQVLGRCCHPNVVRLLAACLTPPRFCLVMERMETSLDRVLYGGSGRSRMPLPKVLHVAVEIARGLEYLHPTIVHRDLKPANVLLNDPTADRPVVKITDFGVSRLNHTTIMTRRPGAGTPAYLAPECYEAANQGSGTITHRADTYSFGVMLWEMLMGSRPWAGCNLVEVATAVAVRRARPPLDALDGGRCPPPLRSLITQCYDHDPLRRPAAAELVKALEVMLQEPVDGPSARDSAENSKARSAPGSKPLYNNPGDAGRYPAASGSPGLVRQASQKASQALIPRLPSPAVAKVSVALVAARDGSSPPLEAAAGGAAVAAAGRGDGDGAAATSSATGLRTGTSVGNVDSNGDGKNVDGVAIGNQRGVSTLAPAASSTSAGSEWIVGVTDFATRAMASGVGERAFAAAAVARGAAGGDVGASSSAEGPVPIRFAVVLNR